MGVYHLMGLGLSPGAVTVPLSYLGHRYQRWGKQEGDQEFFAGSGEVAHRQEEGRKVGDVQALVLFTTKEVISGEEKAFSYADNPPGRSIVIKPKEGDRKQPMQDVLEKLLVKICPDIVGGRTELAVFWCEVDRRDITSTFRRVATVVMALANVGKEGKEIWMNLTGGNNVINFALELAAVLSGKVARLYYIQAEDKDAEKCVRFTDEGPCWVELPVMPLALSEIGQAVLELLTKKGPCRLEDLFSQLKTDEKRWSLVQELSQAVFRETYLTPMWKQRLILGSDAGYSVGPQWSRVRPYQEILEVAKGSTLTLEQLAQQESWIKRKEVSLKIKSV